jgi:farnesyl-diphosphate farnesyltransferase
MNGRPEVGVEQLRGAILRDVSRSFYLSISILPKPLRDPVALGYLLARASDTIADTAELPRETRAQKLRELGQAIQDDVAPDVIVDLSKSLASAQKISAERVLIEALPACFDWLNQLNVEDRSDVRGVLQKINRGQLLDLERFGDGSEVIALLTAADLDEYTYLVAGCVGEFWTRLCFRHLGGFANLNENEMFERGKHYGMGLQLINILRDAHVDLRRGRCYFPREELAAAHMTPDQILREPDRLQPIYRKWREKAEKGIEAGIEYSLAIRNRRVRAATVLPALIGASTLAHLREAGPIALRRQIKISRRDVRRMIAQLMVTLAGRRQIESMFRRYKK